MRLRRADCGHWIPEETKPAGVAYQPHGDQEVFLCRRCLTALLPPIELPKLPAVEVKRGPGRPKRS